MRTLKVVLVDGKEEVPVYKEEDILVKDIVRTIAGVDMRMKKRTILGVTIDNPPPHPVVKMIMKNGDEFVVAFQETCERCLESHKFICDIMSSGGIQ